MSRRNSLGILADAEPRGMRAFSLVTKGDPSCPHTSGIMMNRAIQLYKEHNAKLSD